MNKKRINEYLENIEYICNTHDAKENEIYSWLVRLESDDDHKNINDNFDYWINYYEDKENIRCFCDEYHPFFCEFQNGLWESNDYTIKLYIPMKYDFIKDGVILLFDYLSNENILHHSRVSSTMRNDNVTVRLTNIRDTKKVIEFINNSNIKNNLLETNPFIYNYQGIGLVMDNNLSYNYEVSRVINSYILSRKLFKQKKKPNYEEFYDFVYNCYKDSSNDTLKMIYDLLYSSLNPDYNIYDFYDKVSLYQGNITLLFESLLATRNKYRKNEQAVNSLLMLIKGNYSGVTRKNDYRNRLYYYMDSEMIRRTICSVAGFPKDSTITDEILSNFLKELNRYSLSNTLAKSIAYAVRATLTKIDKYNDSEAYNLTKTYLDTGNHYLLTRDNGARELVLSKTNPDDLILDLQVELGFNLTNDELAKIIVSKIDLEEE